MASALKNLSEYDEANIPSAEELTFGIVVSEWNKEITHALYEGCFDTLIKHFQNGASWFTCTEHTQITLNKIYLGKISLGFNLTIMVLPLKGSSFIDIQDSGTL